MNKLMIYPDNSVHCGGKFLNKFQSEIFLKRHHIPFKRSEDKEIMINGETGMCFATENNAGGIRFCMTCGKNISDRWSAKRCVVCAEKKQQRITAKFNREKGRFSSVKPSGLKVIMTEYNQDFIDTPCGSGLNRLDDLSWTGVGELGVRSGRKKNGCQ